MSYVSGAIHEAGTVVELTASRKEEKYADIESLHVFEPTAIETSDVLSMSARQLMTLFGRRIAQVSGEARETSFLFRRCLV